MMAFAGDTQQALVLVVVQDSTHMAGEDRSVGGTGGRPLALAEIHSWRDTGFLLRTEGSSLSVQKHTTSGFVSQLKHKV